MLHANKMATQDEELDGEAVALPNRVAEGEPARAGAASAEPAGSTL